MIFDMNTSHSILIPLSEILLEVDIAVLGSVSAGYPAEAYNYIEEPVDVNRYISNRLFSPMCTWATNSHMTGEGIALGDLIVIDAKKEPNDNSIILFNVGDGFRLDRFFKYGDGAELTPINPKLSPLILQDEPLIKKGVVTFVIKKFSVYNSGYGLLPSDVENYIEDGMDFNKYVLDDGFWETTFYLWSGGDSMNGDGIEKGDLLVVDKLKEWNHDSILVFRIDGQYTIKRLVEHKDYNELISSNPDYPAMRFDKNVDLKVWGVLTAVVKRYS